MVELYFSIRVVTELFSVPVKDFGMGILAICCCMKNCGDVLISGMPLVESLFSCLKLPHMLCIIVLWGFNFGRWCSVIWGHDAVQCSFQ